MAVRFAICEVWRPILRAKAWIIGPAMVNSPVYVPMMPPLRHINSPKMVEMSGMKRSMIALEYGGPRVIAPRPMKTKQPMTGEL